MYQKVKELTKSRVMSLEISVGKFPEILKALGHTGKQELFEICLDIYRKVTGQEISQNLLSLQ